MGGNNKGNKKQYFDRRGGGGKKYNPKRGGPGILFTAETGREMKCQREGLEILSYYSADSSSIGENPENEDSAAKNSSPGTTSSSAEKLSFDEELKQLKAQSKSKKPSHPGFAPYETGCRGNVFVMRTAPGSYLIEPIKTTYRKELEDASKKGEEVSLAKVDASEDDKSSEPAAKKAKLEAPAEVPEKCNLTEGDASSKVSEKASADEGSSSLTANPWNPVDIVRRFLADLRANSRKMPNSRFITRMIPMQATCFASEEEIHLTAAALIDKFFPSDSTTFAITTKKRNCDGLDRGNVIKLIAGSVYQKFPNCKVDLKNPEVTIVVEVCKTLCGVSVVRNASIEFDHFNVAKVREAKRAEELQSEEENDD